MGTELGFRQYHISVGADGEAIGLEGAEGEEVFLAVDSEGMRFCELHVMAAERMRERDFQRAFYEAAEDYSRLRHPFFPEILESGVDDGIPFYTVAYRDGEGLVDYLKRVGALPARLALGLVVKMAEGLVDYRRHSEFHLPLGAEGFQVFRTGEGGVGLRLGDYGLAGAAEKRHGAWETEFARGCVVMLERLLAGGAEGGDPARWVDAMAIRAEVAGFIGEALGQRHLRLGEVIGTLKGLLAEAPGVASVENYRPEAGLADALVGHAGWRKMLGDYRAAAETGAGMGTTAVGRISSPGSVDKEVRIHAMPPGDVLPEGAWEGLRAVRDVLSDSGDCPALVRLYAVRPGGEAAHIAEEMVDGFSVGEMLASYGSPPLSEAYTILQKVHLAMSQAEAVKLPVVGRLADQVLLTFRGLAGRGAGAGAWSGAEVRLRTHATLRSFFEGSGGASEENTLGVFLGLGELLILGGEGMNEGTRDRLEQIFAEFGAGHGEGSGTGSRESRKWSRGSFLRKIEGMARASGRSGASGPVDDGSGMASAEEVSEDPFADQDGGGFDWEPGGGSDAEEVVEERREGTGVKVAETTDVPVPAPSKKKPGWFRRRG